MVTTTLTDLQTGAGKWPAPGHPATHGRCDPHDQPRPPLLPQAGGTPRRSSTTAHPALYHTKRLASPAQRIMLFANDRGCTNPAVTHRPTTAKPTTSPAGPAPDAPTSPS
ncbi:hypothetical protein ACQKB0_18520 [Mycobacterium tuberculosis]